MLSSVPGRRPSRRRGVLAEGNVSAGGPDFLDDLLRGIDSQAPHFGEPMDRLVVMSEEGRHLLIELAEVTSDRGN